MDGPSASGTSPEAREQHIHPNRRRNRPCAVKNPNKPHARNGGRSRLDGSALCGHNGTLPDTWWMRSDARPREPQCEKDSPVVFHIAHILVARHPL